MVDKTKTTRVAIKEDDEKQEGTLAGEYSRLESLRMPYLIRAGDCAKLTIPSLMPPAGHGSHTKFATPYQGIGARGTNNLASKLLLAILPPGHPFFKYDVPESILAEFGEARGDVEQTLTSIERDFMVEVNSSNARLSLFEGLKQLIVAGNILITLPEGDTDLRVFRLDRYVVRRDIMGGLLKLIIREDISPAMLSEEVRKACKLETANDDDSKNLAVYTGVEFNSKTKLYEVEQEINGIVVPGSSGTYSKENLPYLPLRLIAVDNEDYGRSYVEEYLGDIKSLEGLTKAIVEASAAIAKMVWFVSPNGTTKKKDVVEADNNAVLTGNAQDVTVLQAEKHPDLQVAMQTAKTIEDRLGFAFMLNTAVQRNGERVTAEEIRYVARELEDGLGGIYTVLTQELQVPLLRILMERLRKAGKVPSLPKNIVKPTVITGLEAIGRNQELDKLNNFVQILTTLGKQDRLKDTELIKRIANSLSIDQANLVMGDEEYEQVQQKKMMQQAMMNSAPQMVNQLGGMAQAGMQQQGNPNGTTQEE